MGDFRLEAEFEQTDLGTVNLIAKREGGGGISAFPGSCGRCKASEVGTEDNSFELAEP